MDFGEAIRKLKEGRKVCRPGWNGKNMWLIYVPGSSVDTTLGSPYRNAGLIQANLNPHIDMMTATGQMQPGWLASQTDMLSDDWEIFT